MRNIVLVVAIAACGDDGGGGVSDASVSDTSMADDGAPKHQGLIAILERASPAATTWAALFGDREVVVSSRDDGPCHVQRTMATTTTQFDSAGTLTVSGGTAATVTLPFDPGGYSRSASGLAYAPGDEVTIAATGATVPAFSTQIVFPAPVTVTSGSPTTLHMSGFTATWDATTSAVFFEISQYPTGEPGVTIVCTFDGAAGTGTVPSSALTDFVTSAPATVGVTSRTKQSLTAGEYAFDVFGAHIALVSSNVPVQP